METTKVGPELPRETVDPGPAAWRIEEQPIAYSHLARPLSTPLGLYTAVETR